jgi:hypothetical protein
MRVVFQNEIGAKDSPKKSGLPQEDLAAIGPEDGAQAIALKDGGSGATDAVLEPTAYPGALDKCTKKSKGICPGLYLTLDEASGTTAIDNGITKHNCTIHGNPEWSSGYLGMGLKLDGIDDYLEIPHSTFINIKDVSGRIIELMLNADAPLSSKEQVLYEEGNTEDGINIYLLEDTLYAGIWSKTKGNEQGHFISTSGIEAGKWYQVRLVLDAAHSIFKLYLNGKEAAAGKGAVVGAHWGGIGLGAANNDTTFQSGTKFSGTGHFFKGKIDELIITDPEETCYDVDKDGKCFSEDSCPYDYFNDLLGKGECGLKNSCNYETLVLPTPAPKQAYPYLTNIRLNGLAATFAKVSPGATLTLTYDWQIWNQTDECPTCIQQIYTGWVGLGIVPTCYSVLMGNTPGNSGTDHSTSFTAPLTPGIYFISTSTDWQFNCWDQPATIDPDPQRYLAVVCVQ